MAPDTTLVTGHYLELHDDTANHHKYYTVLSAEDGTIIFAWGRVGTKGQSQVQQVSPFSADDTAGRQRHKKMAGGYKPDGGPQEVVFSVDRRLLLNAREQTSKVTGTGVSEILLAFHKARSGPQFAGDVEGVMRHYDDFTAKAQRLIDEAATKPFEEVYGTFEELKASWEELQGKHDHAGASIQIISGLLAQRLMSGDLTK